MKAAEQKNDIKLVIKGNCLNCKSEEKLKEIKSKLQGMPLQLWFYPIIEWLDLFRVL